MPKKKKKPRQRVEHIISTPGDEASLRQKTNNFLDKKINGQNSTATVKGFEYAQSQDGDGRITYSALIFYEEL